jgi:hypothetical protein
MVWVRRERVLSWEVLKKKRVVLEAVVVKVPCRRAIVVMRQVH